MAMEMAGFGPAGAGMNRSHLQSLFCERIRRFTIDSVRRQRRRGRNFGWNTLYFGHFWAPNNTKQIKQQQRL